MDRTPLYSADHPEDGRRSKVVRVLYLSQFLELLQLEWLGLRPWTAFRSFCLPYSPWICNHHGRNPIPQALFHNSRTQKTGLERYGLGQCVPDVATPQVVHGCWGNVATWSVLPILELAIVQQDLAE